MLRKKFIDHLSLSLLHANLSANSTSERGGHKETVDTRLDSCEVSPPIEAVSPSVRGGHKETVDTRLASCEVSPPIEVVIHPEPHPTFSVFLILSVCLLLDNKVHVSSGK